MTTFDKEEDGFLSAAAADLDEDDDVIGVEEASAFASFLPFLNFANSFGFGAAGVGGCCLPPFLPLPLPPPAPVANRRDDAAAAAERR